MKNFIIKSLELVLLIAFLVIAIGMAILIPIVGIIPGVIIGATVTGMGFVLISINEHLAGIHATLAAQQTGLAAAHTAA